MSNAFLNSLFSEISLPEGALGDIMARYGRTYVDALARNPTLGPAASQLVHDRTKESTYDALLQSGNRFALEAVLNCAVRSDDVVAEVLACWELSPRDQCRLVRPGVSQFFANWIMDNPEFTFGARELAAHQLGCEIEVFFDDADDEPVVQDTQPIVFGRGGDGPRRPVSVLDGLTRGEWLVVVPSRWGDSGVTPWEMIPLGRILVEGLGDASNEDSKDAWMNFLALVESGTEGTVIDVIDVALGLVRAELASA